MAICSSRSGIERLNQAGLDHMQISIDNLDPDDVSKKSLKVLDKKLQMLADYAEFHVNINSVVGGGIQDPNDALAIGKRALELGFESTIGIIHDGDGQLKPLLPDEARVYFEMTAPQEDQLRAVRQVSGGDCPGPAQRLALPRRLALPLHLRGRPGALLLAAARLSRCPVADYTTRGREARVLDGQKLRAELHHRLRAPHQPHRPLARAANPHGGARRPGVGKNRSTGSRK